MEFGLNTETVSAIITLVSLVVTFITAFKKRNWKEALIAVMQTIQKVKVDQSAGAKARAAIVIAEEIKSRWNKDSESRKVAKVGSFIDKIYDSKVKKIEV